MRHRSLEIIARLGIVAILAAGTPASASEEAAPPADDILGAFVEATGGREAHDRIDNRVTRGTMDIVGQGISMDLKIYSARPGKLYMTVESDATGKIEKGTDGEVVWERSAMMGPQIKEGQEKADFLREAIIDKFIRWQEVYKSAESAGVETVDGSAAWKVILTPENGRPQSLFFDQASKLLVKVELTVENPMGVIPLETYLSDYREIDGVLVPYLARVVVMGQERVMTTESVEQNVDLPADRFEIPDEIRALLDDKPDGAEKG